MKHYTPELVPDSMYHIFNHAVSSENLFRNEENYRFFLKKYAEYISPVADTFAYCLMPNHFHFAIRIKSEAELAVQMRTLSKFQTLTKLNYEAYLSKQFSNLFSSYTQSFNKLYQREGSLFRRPFKRLKITDDAYFRQIMHYIHYNPVYHGFTDDLRDWKFSSFESYFSDKATLLKRDEVTEWFHDKENFYAFHQTELDEKMTLELEL